MTPYKKQHYLPVCYLKYFSEDKFPTRKSFIQRHDDNAIRRVTIESQCSGDYFYSKHHPAAAERGFVEYEKYYPRCAEQIISGRTLNTRDQITLILIMVNFFARNASHKNLTGVEEIYAYQVRQESFLQSLIMGKTERPSRLDLGCYIRDFWRLTIIKADSSAAFITSDNPCICVLANSSRCCVEGMILPVTPQYTAIACDWRAFKVPEKLASFSEISELNIWQTKSSIGAIYAPYKLEDSQFDRAKFEMKARLEKGQTTTGSWQFTAINLSVEKLSLFQAQPALL